MELIKNDAVEFIFAIKRFADRNREQDPQSPGIDELKQWCLEVEKKLSPFLINDISLLVEKNIMISIFLFLRIRQNPEIQTVDDFFKHLQSIKAEEFKTAVATELLGTPGKEITREAIYNAIVDDGIHPGYDPTEEANLLLSFLSKPTDFLDRLYKTGIEFYEQAYKQGKQKLQALMDNKYEWHIKRMQEDKNSYLKQLGLLNFLKEHFGEEDPYTYYSFFADNEVSAFWKSYTVVIGAGTDKRILCNSARGKADLFFACFGDPKRLEILRLTAVRPWYSTELAEHFDVKPATLSYHMNKLVEAELLHIRKGESRRFYYTLNKDAVKEYLGFVSQDLLGLDSGVN